MSREVHELLNSTTKKLNDTKNPLAYMWRQHACHIRLTADAYHHLMVKWLEDPRNRVPKHGKDRSSRRGNMSKQLTKDKMSIQTFFEAIRFTKPESAYLILETSYSGGRVFRQSFPIVAAKEDPTKSMELEVFDDDEDDDIDTHNDI